MRGTTPSVRTLLSVSALLVSVLGWLVLAPTQLGGGTSYIIVNGDSMTPEFAKGDLVVTRRADAYAVGDVAAYEHPDLGPVIHRVVAVAGGRYVLRGDANGWLDSHRPTTAQMLGREWLHLPALGGTIEELRSGTALVILCIIMGVLVMSLFATDRGQRRSPRRQPIRRGMGSPPPKRVHRPSKGTARDAVAAVAATALLASLVLGVAAFTRPATVPSSNGADYTHTGTFGYSADAPAGLYDTDRVGTGQPVFRKITDTLELRFGYQLTTKHDTGQAHGDYQLRAQISDPTNGWSRSLLLGPSTPYQDGRFSTTATLDLNEVQQLIEAMEQRTGVRTDRYALTFAPHVTVDGVVGGQPLQESFAPRLAFWLDGLLLQLQTPTGAAGSAARSLHPTQAGGASSSLDQPNTVPVLGLDLPVPTARLMAVLVALLSSICLLLAVSPLVRALRGDQASRIRARFGHLLVTIDDPPAVDGAAVHVNTIGDLVKLANATGRPLLHRPGHDGDDYYVHEPDALYHHRVHRGGGGRLRSAPEPQSLTA